MFIELVYIIRKGSAATHTSELDTCDEKSEDAKASWVYNEWIRRPFHEFRQEAHLFAQTKLTHEVRKHVVINISNIAL